MEAMLAQGLKGVFVDSEVGFSPSLAANFHLDQYIASGALTILPIEDLQDLLEILKALEDSGLSFLIVDSLTSTEAYWGEDESGDSSVSLSANFGKKALQEGTVLNYMIHKCRKAKCAGFIVNHARANIVTGFNAKFAPDHRMAGGYSAKHAPSVVVNLQPGKVQVDAQGNKTGVILKFQAEKNRFAKPFVVYEELLNFGYGIDPKHSVVTRCFAYGIFQPAMKADGSGARAGFYKLPDVCGGAQFSQNTLESVLTDEVLQKLSELLDARLKSELDEIAAQQPPTGDTFITS
jgi:RecA/RadA recombinase